MESKVEWVNFWLFWEIEKNLNSTLVPPKGIPWWVQRNILDLRFSKFPQNIIRCPWKKLSSKKFHPPHPPCPEYRKTFLFGKKFSIYEYLRKNYDFNRNIQRDDGSINTNLLQNFLSSMGGGRHRQRKLWIVAAATLKGYIKFFWPKYIFWWLLFLKN